MLGTGRSTVAIAFGVVLLVLSAIVGVTQGFGSEEPDSDSVAVVEGVNVDGLVEDGQISKESFESSLEQAAKRQGLQEVPPEDDPQYEALRDEALNDVLDTAWILGEASDRGIEASEREVQQEFQQTKDENFDTEKEYRKFLEQTGFTQQDIDLRVRLQLLSTKIQEQITGGAEAPGVPEEDAKLFYEANKEQFAQPASRDVRVVQNPDQAKAQRAFEQLSADNSPESWNKVAAELSTDSASKDSGGVRAGVTEGVFPDPLGAEVFSAPEGEVQGPVSTPQGFFVFQVDAVTDAGSISFEEARAQIDQQLGPQIQQEEFSAFLADYRDYWTERTVCADGFIIERCGNFKPEATPCPDPSLPEDQQQQQLEQTGCPPPVQSNSPGAPGSFAPFTPPQGAPQRPHPAGEDAAAPAGQLPGGLPGGAVPGQPGAPQAAPQGAPPAGQAPPPGG